MSGSVREVVQVRGRSSRFAGDVQDDSSGIGVSMRDVGRIRKPPPLASKETCFLSPRKKIEVLGFFKGF